MKLFFNFIFCTTRGAHKRNGRCALGTKEVSPAIPLWTLSRLRKGKSSFRLTSQSHSLFPLLKNPLLCISCNLNSRISPIYSILFILYSLFFILQDTPLPVRGIRIPCSAGGSMRGSGLSQGQWSDSASPMRRRRTRQMYQSE